MSEQSEANRHVTLGISLMSVSALHLLMGLFIVFVYGGKGGLASLRSEGFLPLYDLLGSAGYTILFIIVLLGFVSGLQLVSGSARGRSLGLVASILNLPLLPFGTTVGIIGLGVLLKARRSGPLQ
ncbi:MAG: hypothetical protein AB1898_10720 [Acidobacteriota bacterium]